MGERHEMTETDYLYDIATKLGKISGVQETQEKWMEKIDEKVDKINVNLSAKDTADALRDETIRILDKDMSVHVVNKDIHQTFQQLTTKAIAIIIGGVTTLVAIVSQIFQWIKG